MEVQAISDAIGEMLEEYADLTFNVTDKALDAGAKVLIKNLKAESPNKTGEFSKSWKQVRKYKLKRYVANSKMVGEKEIPLSNILEYSTKKNARPFIKRTYNNSVGEIANAVMEEVKKGI